MIILTSAFVTPETPLIPAAASMKVAIATSREAELDSPLPRGTLDAIAILTAKTGGMSPKY